MTRETTPVVWGVGTARTIRAHWALCELGVDYKTHEIIPRTETMNDPEFLKRSERGKVPILEHGDLVLGESGAIVFYLADQFRDQIALTPELSSIERAHFDEICFFTMMELDGPLYIIRRHQGLGEIYGASDTAVNAAREYYVRQAQVVEGWLSEAGPFLMGEAFSAADIFVGSCSSWAQFIGIELSEGLAQHLAIVSERDGFKQAFATNFPPAAMAELARNLD